MSNQKSKELIRVCFNPLMIDNKFESLEGGAIYAREK